MDWILSLFVSGMNPLDAIKILDTWRASFLLLFCIAIVGTIIIGPLLESVARSSVAVALILMVVWIACGVGGAFMGWSVIPAWENQLTAMRPSNITPAFEFNTSKFEEIASLDDNQAWSVSGSGHLTSFIIGVGSMSIAGGTKWEYTFYKKVPDGLVLDSIPSDGVVIREDGDANPRIEWITHHSVSENTTYLDDYTYTGGDDSASLFETIIHVPNGTVKKNMNLDARP